MRDWPKLIIFDCDGVLVDSEMIASRELARTLTEAGRPTTPEQSRAAFTGWSLKSVVRQVETELGRPLPVDFLAELRRRDRAAFEAELCAVPGVEDALAQLEIDTCVASSGTPEKIAHSLTLTGLIDWFAPYLFSASGVARGKPAPDLFLAAADAMGCRPRHALVVEDSVAGVRAARRAGMRVFGFTGGSHADAGLAERLGQAGAERTFGHMASLPLMIRRAGGYAPSLQSATMFAKLFSRSKVSRIS